MANWIRKLGGRVLRASRLRKRRQRSFDAPLDPSGWEEAYLAPVAPIREITDPAARHMIELTEPGEVLLEAGCGSAALSAQIALAGRECWLCDFSPKILNRGVGVFEASGLPSPKTVEADLTKPLPLPDGCVDVVWSSGVLEHWEDAELVPILKEMRRVARKKVIALVPFAGSVLYRMAKHLLEQSGRWAYGREMPRESLRSVFEAAGLRVAEEKTFLVEVAPYFLSEVDPDMGRAVGAWWDSLSADDPVKREQGYLLSTVGLVSSN